MEGYSDVKSKSYIHLYVPTIGSLTYAPTNPTPDSDFSVRFGRFVATILSGLISARIAPSK